MVANNEVMSITFLEVETPSLRNNKLFNVFLDNIHLGEGHLETTCQK